MRRKAFVVVVVLVAWMAGRHAVSAWNGGSARGAQVAPEATPAHLRIVSAEVEEVRPMNRNIARRQVRLRIGTAAAPVCPGPATEYGFLIDADKSLATGITEPSFDRLGIDARVVMRCDEKSGRFVSPIGRVTARMGADAPGLDLVTTVGQLPSVDFFWVPYGALGNQLSLLAEAPRFSRWAIIERSIP